MTDLPAIFPGLITVEETQFKAAVSEYTAQRMGEFFNWLATKEHSEKQFFINGTYKSPAVVSAVDGMAFFQFDAEIIDAWMFSVIPGSSGTTQIDVKITPAPASAFTSIFSTLPSINSSAPPNSYIHVGSSLTGCVAPVFSSSPLLVTAGSAIRCDLLSSMVAAQNTGIVVHYRPA